MIRSATALFEQQGFASTTMTGVAGAAAVSVATVEQLFGTKVALLAAAVDVAIAGDDEPVPMLGRERVLGLSEVAVDVLLERVVALVTEVAFRVAPVLYAVEQARGDPQVAELAGRLDRNRSVIARWLVRQLAARRVLSADLGERAAVETALVLLDPAVHRRMIVDWRWSRRRFRLWLGRSLERLLIASP